MKRKLVKQGGNSYTITLPKEWIDYNNLTNKSEIDVQQEDNNLIISTLIKQKSKPINYHINSDQESLTRLILWNIYMKGYDRIDLSFENKKQKKDILNIVENQLLGMVITKEEKLKLEIENITEPDGAKEEVLLRRIFFIIENSLECLNEDLKNNKLSHYQTIKKNVNTISLYDNFCRRSSLKYKNEQNTPFYWLLYNFLLLLHQSIHHLYNELNKLNEKEITNNKYFYGTSTDFYMNFKKLTHAFFKKDINQIKSTNIWFQEIIHEIFQQTNTTNSKKEFIISHYFCEISRLTHILGSKMFGILI